MFFTFLYSYLTNAFSYPNNYLTVISTNTTGWPRCYRSRMDISLHRFREYKIEGEELSSSS